MPKPIITHQGLVWLSIVEHGSGLVWLGLVGLSKVERQPDWALYTPHPSPEKGYTSTFGSIIFTKATF